MDGEDLIVLLLFTFGFIFSMSWTPLGRALVDRLRGKPTAGPEIAALREEIRGLREDLLHELQQQRGELNDVAERLDFAERLLAKQRDAARIPPGRLGGD